MSETIESLRSEITRLQSALTEAQAQGEVIKRIVDAQAEDEGLWFVAQTCAEAYLQQELRKLHAAIESTPPTAVARVIEAARKFKAHIDRIPFRDSAQMRLADADPFYVELQEALAGLDGGRKG